MEQLQLRFEHSKAALQASMYSRHDAFTIILTELANKVIGIPLPFLPPPPPPSLKPPRLLLPTFDGSEVLDWIFQVEHYFLYYNIAWTSSDSIRRGNALSWYKWMHNNHQLSAWDVLVRTLELRFGPFSYENHQATLFKQHQAKSVADYQPEFEKTFNLVVGISHEALLNCFIYRMRHDIKQEWSNSLNLSYMIHHTLHLFDKMIH